jgi:hypothetical protein
MSSVLFQSPDCWEVRGGGGRDDTGDESVIWKKHFTVSGKFELCPGKFGIHIHTDRRSWRIWRNSRRRRRRTEVNRFSRRRYCDIERKEDGEWKV